MLDRSPVGSVRPHPQLGPMNRQRRLRRSLQFAIATLAIASPALAGVKLKAVRFPVGLNGENGTKTPPLDAPISQRVVFEFDGKPKLGPDPSTTLLIHVASTNAQGQPIDSRAIGTFEVAGNNVLFTPRLPTAGLDASFGPTSDLAADASLPGLLPDTRYTIDVDVDGGGVKNLKGVKSGVTLPLEMKTSDDPALWFANVGSAKPKDDPDGSRPDDGAHGVHPNTFDDPAGLFENIGAKKRPPFRLRFKGPLDPSAGNVSSDNLRLRAVKDENGAPIDVVLPADVVLVANAPKRAEILFFPHGILPLACSVQIEWSSKLRTLSGVASDPSAAPATFERTARFRIANDPKVAPSILDRIVEEFDDALHHDPSVAVLGVAPAAWAQNGSGALRATFGFGGDGSIGRFEPPDSVHTIHIDTDSQTFPLFDGSTPDAAPGTVVTGGVFSFTDFHVPPNVTIEIRGSRPALIACTGTCLIEGRVDVRGTDGADDVTFDSAIIRVPGGAAGAGGGRGGDAHPVASTIGSTFFQGMQTPQFGQSGFGPGNVPGGGGGGGQCGCTMPWMPFTGDPYCQQFASAGDGSRGSGGGGGSFQVFLPTAPEDPGTFVSGRRGGIGIGDHLPIAFDPTLPIPAEPEAYDDATSNAVARPNLNPTFADAYAAGMIFDKNTLMDTGTTWATTKRVLLFGNAGPAVFSDADPDNDFIGANGELAQAIGGQGGGAGGSRTEGLSQVCKPVIFDSLHLPLTVLDSRGGSGGGAGGAVTFQALGALTVTGEILATGGRGGGGEEVGVSSRGGAAGGGSGGAVLLQSAVNVFVFEDATAPSTLIDVSGGCGNDASLLSSSASTGTTGGDSNVIQVGDGGPGGPGLVQIQAPPGAPDQIDETRVVAKITRSAFSINCAAVETIDPIVAREKTPAPFTSQSGALSTWYDLGAVVAPFRPSIQTSAGALAGPLFGIPGQGPFFTGTDDTTGLVETEASGAVTTPLDNDFRVRSPDLGMQDFIPNGPTWFQNVRILFQGADEDLANPGTPDLASATAFVADPTLLNGKRFVRIGVSFDISAGVPFTRSLDVPRPQMDSVDLPFRG